MRLKTMFRLWLPLAVSFELMMLEGPAVQRAMTWLPDPALNLAAWGLTMSLSLLIESPVIMLLATAIALVKDGPSYRALKRFMVTLSVGCTALTGLVAFTPLFEWASGTLMGQPAPIVAAAKPAMQIMLLWTAAIAWRRFYQGVLVARGQTRKVSAGTAIRLVAAVGTAVGLAAWGRLSGVQVAAWAIMAAVVTEALATTAFARPVIRRDFAADVENADLPPLTQRDIWRFHAPLAATTLLTLLAQPITSAALARLEMPQETLAAWPVVFMILLVMRGWGLALQEISVAQAREPTHRPALHRLTWLVGGVTTAATALVAFTPLLTLYLDGFLKLPRSLHGHVFVGVAVGVLLPLVTALGSWARGLLVAAGETRAVYRGMGVNLLTHGGLLALGVVCGLPGMWVAAGAFTLAATTELGYLMRRVQASHAEEAGRAVPAPASA